MQKFIRRVVWGSVWIATYAIIVYLCTELADGQPVMLALLLLAAFVASVGLVYARQSFQSGDWTVGAAALIVSAFSLAVSVVGDISYWSGTLESVHEQVIRDRAIHEGQTLVMTRQKERYSALASGQSAEQLQAAMAGALAKTIGDKTLGARTKDCTDTASYHYRSCTEYLSLKAKFAAASEAQKLESVVWSAGTNVEKPGRRRDFYRAAVGIADATGWTVENSILAITITIVTLLQALLMLSLYCGSSPSRQDRATAAKAPEATELGRIAFPPVAPRSLTVGLPKRDDLTRRLAVSSPEIPDNSPPDPPGDAKPVAATAEETSAVEPEVTPAKATPAATYPKLVTDDWNMPPVTPRTKAERLEAVDVITKRWLAQGTVIRAPFNLGSPIYADYCNWCQQYGVTPVNDSHFGRSLRRLKVATKKKRQGIHYGLKLVARPRHRNRAVAAIAA